MEAKPSFTFTFNIEHNFFVTQYFGLLTVEDFRESAMEGKALYPGIDGLIDFSEASLVNITKDDITSLIQIAVEYEPTNILSAFIAPGDLEFGLARMFDTRASINLPEKRAVFRSYPEALDWLLSQRSL